MYSEQPGWYHAEGDPADTKRFWNGLEWEEGLLGGNVILYRILARVIDGLIVFTAGRIVSGLLLGEWDLDSVTASVISFLIAILYEVGFIAIKGKTPGKIILRFKVVAITNSNSPPSTSSALSRFAPNLSTLLPVIGFYLGFAIVGISLYWLTSDANRQSVFDRFGKTYVVRLPR